MLKKLLNLTLAAFLAVSFSAYAEEETFVQIKVPFPDGDKILHENYQKYSSIMLRYADDKKPIALCAYYDGYVWGTVPKENENRKTEVYFADKAVFADETDEYEYYMMKKLAQRGIIFGDENNNANPFDNITRAEAVAITMRIIGVDESKSADSGFDDVPADMWCAPVVKKARDMGIIKGTGEKNFEPERNVTREEMVIMAARAVLAAGLKNEPQNVTAEDLSRDGYVKDYADVSAYALSAYKLIGTSTPCDHEDTGEIDPVGTPVSVGYLRPSKDITRFETAEMADKICDYFQIYPSQTAIELGFDKKMPVIDGSTSTYPFTEAVYSCLFYNGYEHKEKPKKHSKSYASYEKLINGENDVIIASVYPAQEILDLAKENNVELELVPIAYDAMIFFTNKANSIENLTQEQITNIYVDNKYANWEELGGPDAALYPYARNYDSGSHAQMQRHFLHGKDINEKIRKETTSVTMSNVLTDVMDCMTENPKGYGLGYSIYYYFNNMNAFYNTFDRLKLLKIDGVAPNDETIASGEYPLSNNTYVVFRKDEPKDSPARKFADFMLTDKGQLCVEVAGFGPLRKTE